MPLSPALTRRRLLALAAALAAAAPARAENTPPKGGPALSAPIHVSRIGLRVRDAQKVAAWYEAALGLQRLPQKKPGHITLGAGGVALLELIEDPALRLAERSEAGLYHTAFLLPSRADLGLWVQHAIERQIPVEGVADHLVSEAIYLSDPEGNGIEIYADRDPADWNWQGDQVQMGTEALDVEGLLALNGLLPVFWSGAPEGTRIGHVHLKVGDAAKAAQFWQDDLGFDTVRARADAVFLSTGGYHHHIAVNAWDSPGAGRRDARATGLDFVELASRLPLQRTEFEDPWGTRILLRAV